MIAVLLLLTALLGQSPTLDAALPDLLPLAADLDGACELVPRRSETLDGGRARSGPWGPLALPANPWRGEDPATVAAIRDRVVGTAGGPRLPDGPPLDRGALERFRHEAVEGERGYAAAYQNEDQRVLVYALQSGRLNEGERHGAVGPRPGSHMTERFREAGLWVWMSGSDGVCFSALRRHMEQVLAERRSAAGGQREPQRQF